MGAPGSLDLGGRTAGQVSELAQEYPLLLGAIGLAPVPRPDLTMRPTESEDELIGSYSDSLEGRAARYGDGAVPERRRRGRTSSPRDCRQPAASSGRAPDGIRAPTGKP